MKRPSPDRSRLSHDPNAPSQGGLGHDIPSLFDCESDMTEPTRASLPSALIAIAIAGTSTLAAQNQVLSAEDYLEPPRKIRNVLESEAMWRQESMSNKQPDGQHFLLSRREGMVPLERISRPYVNLGETPIDHNANRSRSLTTGTTVGYELFDAATGKRRDISTPTDAIVSNASWSPDGKSIAFLAHYDDASYLYLADASTGQSRRVTGRPLSLTLVRGFRWSRDGRKILVTLIPNERGEMPERRQTPQEPAVWVNHPGKTPSRTYRFLLKTPHDARLLEWLSMSQLALVSIADGSVQEIGKPAMFRSIDLAPDGKHFRVTTMQKPFSYFVPARSFGSKDELWSAKGKVVHMFSERKLNVGGQRNRTQTRPQTRPQTRTRNQTTRTTGRGQGRTQGRTQGRGQRGGDTNREERKRSLAWRPDGKGMSFLQLAPLPKKPDAKKGDAKKGDTKKGDAKKGDAKNAPTKKGDVKKSAPKSDAKTGVAKKKPDARMPGTKAATKTDDATKTAAAPTDRRARMRRMRDRMRTDGQGSRRGRGPRGARGTSRRGTQGASATANATANAPKRKDRVMIWKPPYGKKDVEVVWESDEPIRSVQYSKDCKRIYVSQRKDGKSVVFAVDLDKPKVRMPIVESKVDAATEARMAQIPARFRARMGIGSRAPRLLTKSSGNASYVRTSKDGKSVFLQGRDEPKDATTETARSWIDRYEVATKKKTRVWQAAKGEFSERLLSIMDDDIAQVVVARESETMVPNSYLVDTKTNETKRLTDNRDPAPEVTASKRMRIKIKRVDGFEFWCRVTIPTGYGERLPALFWFYPREFTDQKTYDDRAKRGVRPHRFPMVRSRSMELFTMLGYVVVQPDCPIVGPQGRMNDNYVPDLRNSLWAVIDELDKRRIIDRDRLAIGGHSYGAFGTANAMIHTPFFKAGIAGDGNYNRTLTPMSFQSERRYLWDARETYTRMSPIFWVNQLQGALLMYHGMDDNNTGTFPINSPRMFQALDGVGKTTALYQYPYEGHAPVSRESVHDLWARWVEWLDTHVKNHGKKKTPAQVEPDRDITERR